MNKQAVIILHEIYTKIKDMIYELKKNYEKVFIVGFSVGATIICPTLLIFAKEDSFDVNHLVSKLEGKEHLEIVQVDARHVLMDIFSNHFNARQSKYAGLLMNDFLSADIL